MIEKNNKMKEYLGADYSDNHLRNFCLYWMRAAAGSGDEWRKENDLDCLYYRGDLRADTLMSAWTPIKWVVDCINADAGIKVYKYHKGTDDKFKDLRALAEDRERFLPSDHVLVKLLDEFLELAELECNFILLPDKRMNRERYGTYINGEKLWLFDEVPSTLYHIFNKETLGKYFKSEKDVIKWIRRQTLTMGFDCTGMNIGQAYVRPLIKGHSVAEPKWLTSQEEIEEALRYMISFLKERKARIEYNYESAYYTIRDDH